MKRPLESAKSYPGWALVLRPAQVGGNFCLLFPAFTKCYSLVGQFGLCQSGLALIIEAQDSCQGGIRRLDCRPKKLWGLSELGQMPQEEGVLPRLQSHLLITHCLGLKYFLLPFFPSSLLPTVCTDPAIKPSHSEGKGTLYCTAIIKQQMT